VFVGALKVNRVYLAHHAFYGPVDGGYRVEALKLCPDFIDAGMLRCRGVQDGL
jgi:hypothetical protein